ncbi:hypothetical protein AMAG_05311 [Allomyces macrogynus ATCC 38327]|uniref:Uncharacterized protein n=1 Tax=Allomyces macrogynus (strain ATCC 38327) TaxID=578462 RepID=A0A0L0SBC0_ALLM3|nr:hypothetical protein AMAG_05311 [Allomyces macrogynus ATCC 38327]|eukprot:KNE59858.1 hypothetical protein AMAG_05311 [Allomyces macrogynus ATCC 38327]
MPLKRLLHRLVCGRHACRKGAASDAGSPAAMGHLHAHDMHAPLLMRNGAGTPTSSFEIDDDDQSFELGDRTLPPAANGNGATSDRFLPRPLSLVPGARSSISPSPAGAQKLPSPPVMEVGTHRRRRRHDPSSTGATFALNSSVDAQTPAARMPLIPGLLDSSSVCSSLDNNTSATRLVLPPPPRKSALRRPTADGKPRPRTRKSVVFSMPLAPTPVCHVPWWDRKPNPDDLAERIRMARVSFIERLELEGELEELRATIEPVNTAANANLSTWTPTPPPAVPLPPRSSSLAAPSAGVPVISPVQPPTAASGFHLVPVLGDMPASLCDSAASIDSSAMARSALSTRDSLMDLTGDRFAVGTASPTGSLSVVYA